MKRWGASLLRGRCPLWQAFRKRWTFDETIIEPFHCSERRDAMVWSNWRRVADWERGREKLNENRWPIEGWCANYTTLGRDHLILGRRSPAFLRTEVGDGPVLCAHTVLSAASHMARAENPRISPLNQLMQPDPAVMFLVQAVRQWRAVAAADR